MARNSLSEIESCVLAYLAAEGPATTYAVRQVFLRSPNPQWSGSAGTIYPLIRRLRQRHLIRAEDISENDRGGQRVSVTAAGRRSLENWFAVPVEDWVAGVPPDPLRTRIRFLEILAPPLRRHFVRNAYQAARRHLAVIEEECASREGGNIYLHLTSRGALLSMHARIEYLREVAARLSIELND